MRVMILRTDLEVAFHIGGIESILCRYCLPVVFRGFIIYYGVDTSRYPEVHFGKVLLYRTRV